VSFHFIYFTTIIALAILLYFVPFHLFGQAARHYQPRGYTGITDVQPHKITAKGTCRSVHQPEATQNDSARLGEETRASYWCVDRRRGYDYRTRPHHGTTVLYLDYCEFERTARFENSHQLSCRPIRSSLTACVVTPTYWEWRLSSDTLLTSSKTVALQVRIVVPRTHREDRRTTCVEVSAYRSPQTLSTSSNDRLATCANRGGSTTTRALRHTCEW